MSTLPSIPLAERKRSLSPRGLKIEARTLHKPRIMILNVGWLCVGAAAVLSLMGIAAIDTTIPDVLGPKDIDYAKRQLIFLGIGIVAAVAVSVPHFRLVRRLSYPLIAISLVLLIFVLVPWVPEFIVRPRNGARRWINLGVTDIQPSEVAKMAYIVALANYLRFRTHYRQLPGLILLVILTLIPMGLIVIEPDLGTSLLFLPTLFAMVLAAGGRLRHVALIIALGAASIPLMYPLLKPYQQQRVKAMVAQVMGSDRYAQDIGFQGDRAITLIGAGGLMGVGRDHAQTLVINNRLPEEHNDMVFSVVCCRWGLLGGAFMWAMYLVFAIGGLLVAGVCKDPFGRLVAVGITAITFTQMVINTGMNVGLLPITGMTLPFVSYGGTSLIVSWVSVGLLLNIGMRRAHHLWRESFDFGGKS